MGRRPKVRDDEPLIFQVPAGCLPLAHWCIGCVVTYAAMQHKIWWLAATIMLATLVASNRASANETASAAVKCMKGVKELFSRNNPTLPTMSDDHESE
jgi:hypothetical protein